MSPSKQPTLRERALATNKTNPSQLGDPISLKAETSSSEPPNPTTTSSSSSAAPPSSSPTKQRTEGEGGEKKTLRQLAMDKLDSNPSQLGDPISLKAETADSEPTDQDRGAAGGKSKL